MGRKEKMNSFIFSFKPILVFNPNHGIETCRAGLLRNNYNIRISVNPEYSNDRGEWARGKNHSPT